MIRVRRVGRVGRVERVGCVGRVRSVSRGSGGTLTKPDLMLRDPRETRRQKGQVH